MFCQLGGDGGPGDAPADDDDVAVKRPSLRRRARGL